MIQERMAASGYKQTGKYIRKMAIDVFIINIDYTDVKELTEQIRKIYLGKWNAI